MSRAFFRSAAHAASMACCSCQLCLCLGACTINCFIFGSLFILGLAAMNQAIQALALCSRSNLWRAPAIRTLNSRGVIRQNPPGSKPRLM